MKIFWIWIIIFCNFYCFGASLVAYYSFNQSTGLSLPDLSGNNNNGVLNNFPTSPNPWQGGSLHFDGVDDYVRVEDNNSLDFTDAFTVSVWINPDYAQGGHRRIIEKHYDTSWYFGMTGTNGLSVYLNGAERAVTANGVVGVNSWTHVAFSFNRWAASEQLKIYVNGVVQATGTYTSAIGVDTNFLRIGDWMHYAGYAFAGYIDEVSLWNGALSTQEMTTLYTSGIIPEPSSFLLLAVAFLLVPLRMRKQAR